MHLVGLVIADPYREREKGVRNYVHPAGGGCRTQSSPTPVRLVPGLSTFNTGLPWLGGKGLEALRVKAKRPRFWPSLPVDSPLDAVKTPQVLWAWFH